MFHRNTTLIIITFSGLFLLNWPQVFSQNLDIGFTAGLSGTWAKFNTEEYYDQYNSQPGIGYSIGPALDFQVNDHFSLTNEVEFSVKGRRTVDQNNKNNYIRDRFYLAEATGLLHGEWGSGLTKFFVNVGPRISYWLGGSGKVLVSEFLAGDSGPLKYRTTFNPPESNEEYRFTRPNRFLIGLDAGIGGKFKIYEHWILTELRFQSGHTNLGDAQSEYVNDLGFTSFNRFTLKALTFKITYFTDWENVANLISPEEDSAQ